MTPYQQCGDQVLKMSVSRLIVKARLGGWRGLHSSVFVNRIFDVSKVEDFEKEVLLAKKPVLVDFHAG